MLRLAVVASLIASTAFAAEPLVKPVVAPAGKVRVDFPLTEGDGKPFMVAGLMQPRKSGEKPVEVKVAYRP